jgi:hypothetical protein
MSHVATNAQNVKGLKTNGAHPPGGMGANIRINGHRTRAERWAPFASEIIGVRAGTKRPLTPGWSTWQGHAKYMADIERRGDSFGMLARKYPAVDIDITLPALAGVATKIAYDILGAAPMRTRGTCKALLMYRTDEPLRKRRLVFKAADGSEHAVELLATGQQYVIEGNHPDGQPYTWSAYWDPANLNVITSEQWERYCEALAARLTVLKCTIEKDGLGGAARVGERVRSPEELLAPDPEHDPIAAMKGWQHGDQPIGHDKFIDLCASFHGAAGQHADELFDDFRECLPAPRDTEPNTEKQFFSFDSGVRLGWSRLCQITGYMPPDVFDDMPAADVEAMATPDPTAIAMAEVQARRVYIKDLVSDPFPGVPSRT